MNYWQFYKNSPFWKRSYHVIRARLAKYWISRFPKTDVIAVTGSVGKTTAKEAIALVLSSKYSVVSSEGNLDPVFNIPLTLLKIRPWIQKVVLEYGVEYPNEMDFYLDLIKPNIGCITRIYWTHTEFLKDIDGVIFEKLKLLKALPKNGYAVLNYDDENIRNKMAPNSKASVFWFGKDTVCDLIISDYKNIGNYSSTFKLSYKGEEIEVSWKLIGEQQTIAAAVAASIGILSGLNLKEIKNGLEKLSPQPHRMNLLKAENCLILDDCYNSSPIAVIEALTTLSSFNNKHKIIVLSDMKELGVYSKNGHQEIAKYIFDVNPDLVFLIGEQVRYTALQLETLNFSRKKIKHFSIDKTSKQLREITNNPLILIKGSRHTHLERLVFLLENKDPTINCSVCGKLSITN